MEGVPRLRLADGDLAFETATDVLVVDPSPTLVSGLVDAWIRAAPAVATPNPEDLRAAHPDSGRGSRAGSPEPRRIANGRGPDSRGGAAHRDPTDRAGETSAGLPRLELLGRRAAFDAVFEEFHTASRAAGLEAAGLLAIRVADVDVANALLVAGDTAGAIVDSGADGAGERYAVAETDAEVADVVRGDLHDDWVEASSYVNRTPARSAVFAAYADRFDPDVAADVLRLLDASEEIRRGDPCDHLVRPYLVGARREALHYDLRRAGEDAGLASLTTFSTVKSNLVDAGLIAVEAVPQEVGRDRERIVLADDRLRDAPLSAYPEIVTDLR